MTSIFKHTYEKCPVLRNSIILFDDENKNKSVREALIINNLEESEVSKDECKAHFDGPSQTESQLSTVRLAITNDYNNNGFIEISTYYKHALSIFENMTNSCKTKK